MANCTFALFNPLSKFPK